MTRKNYKAEQIVVMLREVEIQMAKGLAIQQVCRNQGISEQTYYRWRRKYGGMKLDQAKRLKELEQENSRLKKLVADLSLDKAIIKEVAKGKF